MEFHDLAAESDKYSPSFLYDSWAREHGQLSHWFARTYVAPNQLPAPVPCLPGLSSYPEDRGSRSLRNVGNILPYFWRHISEDSDFQCKILHSQTCLLLLLKTECQNNGWRSRGHREMEHVRRKSEKVLMKVLYLPLCWHTDLVWKH
jgi:hypothetical protein